MPSEKLFRFSAYLSLMLSCLCVGYAEWEFFPEVSVMAGVAIVALAVLFQLETRIQLLSLSAANRLGLVLGLLCFGWIAFRIGREFQERNFVRTPWIFLLPPLVGPILLASMPAKLARREKHVGDYRALYGMGLTGALLAGVMSEDALCFFLVALYVAAAVWSLGLLYLRQAGGMISSRAESAPPYPEPPAGTNRGRVPFLGQTVVFLLASSLVAVPLYIVTPRSNFEQFSFTPDRIEVGYAADQMIDLKKTGKLKINHEVAFEVTAEVRGHPKRDLLPDQRWRGRVLRHYQMGEWKTGDLPLTRIDANVLNHLVDWTAPDLGPGQVTLDFFVHDARTGYLTAEPIVWATGQNTPLAAQTDSGMIGFRWFGDGSFLFEEKSDRFHAKSLQYRQIWKPQPDPNVTPLFLPRGFGAFSLEQTVAGILVNPVPRVKDYAKEVLDELVKTDHLPQNCRDPFRELPRPEYHDRVAVAFANHLSRTKSLTYTTNLQRGSTDVDPVEDFLFYTHAGHCERYATALALMLRSQGIPAVLVLGFKGCEATDVPGRYVVREEHAHAWVDALVPDYEAPKVSGKVQFRWRSLDPSPVFGDDEGPNEASPLKKQSLSWFKKVVQKYLVNYTAEQRLTVLGELARLARQPETYLILAGLVGIILAARWLARRNRSRPVPSKRGQLFDELVNHLTPFGFEPQPNETPLEFASRVSTQLKSRDPLNTHADVPVDWVEAYYDERYGGTPVPPLRRDALAVRLQDLTGRLKKT